MQCFRAHIANENFNTLILQEARLDKTVAFQALKI